MLRPGFEPGSVTREATILDRTILPELGILRVGYHEQLWFNKNSDSREKVALPAEAQLDPKSAHGYPHSNFAVAADNKRSCQGFWTKPAKEVRFLVNIY